MHEWRKCKKYHEMLARMASLSLLFKEKDKKKDKDKEENEETIPFLYYRVTERLFCIYCNAKDLARDDSAYDARIGDVGIGIKTFTLKNKGISSVEKIAEFNKFSPKLRPLSGDELALKLAEFRNERMLTANGLYGIKESYYHIIGRTEGRLEIFDAPYDFVDTDSIHVTKEDDKSLQFDDKNHHYTFNKSKSVLQKRFIAPEDRLILPVEIIANPYELLDKVLSRREFLVTEPHVPESPEELILPLFSVKGGKRYVPEKSGLNIWNAAGRPRDPDEVYIPVPKKVHREHPEFFPKRDTPFLLKCPDGRTLSAKICQDGGKALMTNPNRDLGLWLLRQVLRLKHGELLTYDKLLCAGRDSVKITRLKEGEYSISLTEESYDTGEEDWLIDDEQ